MNPRRTLIVVANQYRNPRWAVVRTPAWGYTWTAAAPVGSIRKDRFFHTHGEAIAYADKMARREKAS